MRHRFAIALMSLFAVACGGPTNTSGPERTDITVGVLPTWDAAAVYVAVENEYFRDEGLEVTPVVLANSEEAVSRNLSGAVDIAHDGYVTPIMAASKGLRLRIIVDSAQAKPGMYVIVVPGTSPVRSPKDLAGTTVGMTNSKGLPALLTDAALRSEGVDDVRFVDVPYPTMGAALQNGSIDASFATDPFLTRFRETLGARVVLDTIGGPTDDFPIGCYHTTPRFAEQNPRTVAAFQRAMARAQEVATRDRGQVSRVLPKYIKGLTRQMADTIAIGTFATSLDKSQAQRVADFMTEQGVLDSHFDVSGMVE